jgi:hypothetical protein
MYYRGGTAPHYTARERARLVDALQVEVNRLWHDVGRPDTDQWQAWPEALASFITERKWQASTSVRAIGKREAGTWTVSERSE